MAQDWTKASAMDQGRAIAAGTLDPVALTQAYLDRIDGHEFGDRIYARTTPDRALAEAHKARDRAHAGLRHGPLDGVPISWKDLFDTAGTATEAGSALLAGRVPDRDALVLERATRAGLVCLGKTHMSELAFSGLGMNPITATPPCVNDHDAVPGGSSSGAAASVAFDLAAAGIGSDTGGSVRIPSAWNDLVGLKTTSGQLSLQGVVPLCATFDTVGPLCRTVEDAAQLYTIMADTPPVDLAGASVNGMRLAICETVALDKMEPAPARSFETAVAALRAAGAIVDQIKLPVVADALSLSACLFTAEAYATWKTEIEANPGVMFPEILDRFSMGRSFSAVEYIRSWQTLLRLRAEYQAATAGYDAVIVPSSPILPPNQEKLKTDSDTYVSANLLALRNTRIGNLMGLCGLTLPTTEKSCGLMLLAPANEDRRLLRMGAAIEPIVS